ncbi:MAG: hypothetical protein ACJ77K_09390 [Bacteroidia bacterium]
MIRVHNGTSYSTLATPRSSADPVIGDSHYAGAQADGLVLMMGGAPYYRHPQTSTIRLPLRDWGAYAFVESVYMTDSLNFRLGSYLQLMQDYLRRLDESEKEILVSERDKSALPKRQSSIEDKNTLHQYL